jgi:hypothetical protein
MDIAEFIIGRAFATRWLDPSYGLIESVTADYAPLIRPTS